MSLDHLLDCATRARVPVLIWGPPGVGKSAAIQAWAGKRGLRCWTVLASLREPADFGGLPIIGGDASHPCVTFAPPRFAVEAGAEGGVIFLDELTTAPPAVQAALLRAVIDRAFGDLELDPRKVTLLAAANPPGEAAGGWDLAAPLANRFTHHPYRLVARDWVEAFPGYWGQSPVLGFGDVPLCEAAWSRARCIVAGFVRARPAMLLLLPEDESKRGQAWPSPRTWDFASRLLASVAQGGGSPDDALPLVAGCVGEGAALEFCQFARELDLPDPEALLARPGSYRHSRRGDQTYAVLSAVCQAAIGKLTAERWLAAWQILAAAAGEGGADIAAGGARSLARAQRSGLPLPAEEISAFFPILKAVGLIGR